MFYHKYFVLLKDLPNAESGEIYEITGKKEAEIATSFTKFVITDLDGIHYPWMGFIDPRLSKEWFKPASLQEVQGALNKRLEVMREMFCGECGSECEDEADCIEWASQNASNAKVLDG